MMPNQRFPVFNGGRMYAMVANGALLNRQQQKSVATIIPHIPQVTVSDILDTEIIFTAQCTTVQSVVLLSHVVCPSICPSLTLVDHDHICWKSWKL